jgi:phospholipid/cholesterol/gamma-HCH transport system substrate-binding protein
METRANYLLVGLFVIGLFVGSVGFVIWLTDLQVDRRFEEYDIGFSGSVAGLREGASVSYRGINVGTVESIAIDPNNLERILVTVQVRADTPIRTDTTATLAIQGLAGGAYILLSGGTQDAPALEPQEGQKRAVIVAQASGLQELLESAPSVLTEANIVLKRASDLLNDSNRAEVATALATLTGLLANLDSAAKDLPDLTSRAGQALDDVGQIAQDLRPAAAELPEMLRRSGDTVDKVGRTAESVTSLADNLNTTASALPEVVAQSSDTIGKIGNTAESVTQLSGNLNETAELLPDLARRSGKTLDKFGGTAESITQLADALGEDSKRLAEQADATLASLRSTAATLNTTVANADDDVEATLTAIRDSAENFQRLAANLEGFVSENREPLAEFSNQGLFEVTTFFNQARELVNNINRLLLQVERDPTSFFLGNGQQGYEPATKK